MGTPIQKWYANTQILQTGFDKIDHLIPPRLGLDKIWILLNMFQQAILRIWTWQRNSFLHAPVLPAGHNQDICHPQLPLGPEGLTRRTVPALMVRFKHITLVINLLKQLLYHLLMPLFGGAHKIIVGDKQFVP